jgi:Toastrack DUF4097
MKRSLTISLGGTLTVFVAILSTGLAQQSGDPNDSWCSEGRFGRTERSCEVREFRLDAPARLTVDGGVNGGITVKGWNRKEVWVRAKVEAWSDREDPQTIVSAIEVHTDDARVRAEGPAANGWRSGGWSVSYDVMVPFESDLSLDATNGGIRISEVRGDLDFRTTNGGIRLERIGGEVRGRTTNGGITAEIDGREWAGRLLDLETTNGAVTLEVPDNFQADLTASTVNGGIRSDFPVVVQGRFNSRRLQAELNGGGAPVRLQTVNGRVELRKR